MKKISIIISSFILCTSVMSSETLQLLEGKTSNGRKCHIRFAKTKVTSDYTAFDNSFYFYSTDSEGGSASTFTSSFESKDQDEMLHIFKANPGTYDHPGTFGIDQVEYQITESKKSKLISIKPRDKKAYLDEYNSYFEMSIKMSGSTVESLNRKYFRTSFWRRGAKKVFDETCIINKELNI